MNGLTYLYYIIYGELTKVHYINLSGVVLFVKASIIVISIHLKNQASL